MKINKIYGLTILAACLILFGCQPIKKNSETGNVTTYTGEKSKKPNVIFVLVDDMGWGDLGVFYQDQRKKKRVPYEVTPHLDKMAKMGAQLRDHYDAAPVCAPSRASILLGLSQAAANVRDNQFDKGLEDNHTMASVMRKLGYSTIAIGKYGEQGNYQFNPKRNPWFANPLKRGFDTFFGYMRHEDGHEHYPKEGVYSGDSKQVWHNHTDTTPELDKCYTADLWTAYAKKWIIAHEKGNDSQKPFFMYLAYDTPHAVLELPTQSYPKGGGLHGGLQWLGKPGHMINTASGKVDSWVNPKYAHAMYKKSSKDVSWPDVYKRYATAVSRIDSGVGDIMQLLKDLHIAKNTIVVFTSDNGPSRESYLNHSTR
ncbi:MAG TPA: sulfatase-like hydrolase/transferase, partial [Balneolales bacterium]|nr:sulfatase-like hydrolase/transferase [Balneolales bacterium]